MALNYTVNTSDELNLGSASSLLGLGPSTYLFWFLCTGFAQGNNYFPRIYSSHTTSVSGFTNITLDHHTFGRSPNSAIGVDRKYSTTDLGMDSGDGAWTANEWTFLAVVDGGAGVAPLMYIGTLDTLAAEPSYATQTTPAGSLTSDSGASIHIGARPINTSNSFAGDIAWAAVYNEVLSQGEIWEAQYSLRNLTDNVRLNMHLGYAGTGTQFDLSGQGNTGSPTGLTVADHVPLGPFFGFDVPNHYAVAAAAANPKGPLGMPLHGPFGGPI